MQIERRGCFGNVCGNAGSGLENEDQAAGGEGEGEKKEVLFEILAYQEKSSRSQEEEKKERARGLRRTVIWRKFQECSQKERVEMATSAETPGVNLRMEQERPRRMRFSLIKRIRVFQKHFMSSDLRKLLRNKPLASRRQKA